MRRRHRWSSLTLALGLSLTAALAALAPAAGAAARQEPVTRSVGVVPVYWSVPKPAALATAPIAAAVASADHYLDQVSMGNVRLTMGTVRPWLKLDGPYPECSTMSIQWQVRQLLAGQHVDDDMVIALAPGQGCAEPLWTEVSGSIAWTTAAMDLSSPSDPVTHITPAMDVMAGQDDAAYVWGSLTCWTDATKTVRTPYSRYCDEQARDDPWDPAGTRPYGAYGTPTPDNLLRLRPYDDYAHRIYLSYQSARVHLRPMSTAGPWLVSAGKYSLEYRPTAGVDSWVDDATALVAGIERTTPGGGIAVRFGPRLLDMHPDGTFDPVRRHPGLESGESWTAPSNEWTFKVRSMSDAEAVVDVRYGQLPVQRLAGDDRFETSAAAASGAKGGTVFVASGRVFPDALSGTPAAGRAGASILLTDTDTLPQSVAGQIATTKPMRIVVLGGPATVSESVLGQLRGLAPQVERWSGADRFATSVAISRAGFDAGVPVAFVASGRTFPDALSVGPVAAKAGGPILLTDTHALPEVVREELTRLRPARIVLVGGPATVSPEVESALASYTSGSVERWGGADRYAVSALAAAAYPSASSSVVVVSGEVFSDALSGGPLAYAGGGPLLLVGRDRVPDAVATQLTRLRPDWITVVGGPSTVSDSVAKQLRAYVP